MKFPRVSQKDIEIMVNGIFDGMAEALVAGDRIELRGFGSMEVRIRGPRRARNPRTGERVEVGARRTAVFHPGKEITAQFRIGDGSEEEGLPASLAAAAGGD